MKFDYDLIVIGAGSGGLPLINAAHRFGLRVAIVEKEKIGGDCLNFGCVPSKTLIKSARVLHTIRNAPKYGLPACRIEADFKSIMDRLRSVQSKIEEHESTEYFESLGVDVFIASPSFEDRRHIRIGDRTLSAKKFVISTGSRASLPPIPGLAETSVLTNVEIFQLDALPESMIVLGGGPIGVEMAQTFSRFGSKVTLIEMEPHILIREDAEMAMRLQGLLQGEGIEIRCGSRVVEIGREGPLKYALIEHSEGRSRVEASEILVSLGRRPNLEGLELEKAGVRYNQRGIVVNSRMRTSARNIFAVGDVVGPYYFSHVAAHQAGVAFANLFLRLPTRTRLDIVPWTTFSDPELARAGLTEKEARTRGLSFEVARFELSELDRALTESETEGFSKILISRGKIIGVHLLGSHAGDVFHTLLLAMKQRLSVSQVARMIYVYPTNAEIINRTLGQYFFKKIYSDRMKRIVRRLY